MGEGEKRMGILTRAVGVSSISCTYGTLPASCARSTAVCSGEQTLANRFRVSGWVAYNILHI